MTGKFIIIEGPDGCGKTTQAKMLHAYFEYRNIPSVLTFSPGSTEFSNELRSLLLSGKHKSIGALGELFLFAAARCDLIRNIIQPAMAEGKIVIADRFYLSAAYQLASFELEQTDHDYREYNVGMFMETIWNMVNASLNLTSCDGVYLYPSVTYYLDVPIEIGMVRRRKRNGEETDRFEAEGLAFQESVKSLYGALIDNERYARTGRKIKVIECTESMTANDVHKQIVSTLSDSLRMVL